DMLDYREMRRHPIRFDHHIHDDSSMLSISPRTLRILRLGFDCQLVRLLALSVFTKIRSRRHLEYGWICVPDFFHDRDLHGSNHFGPLEAPNLIRNLLTAPGLERAIFDAG